MDADAPCGVAVGVARVRLIADPGSSPEIVVVSCRERDVDGIGDLPLSVGPERSAVERLAGLPGQPAGAVRRAQELLDLDDDVLARPKTYAANRDGNRVTGLRRQRDARLSPVSPGLDARIDTEQQARDHQPEPRIDRDLLLGRAFTEGKGGNRAGEDRKHGKPEGAVAR